MKAERGGDEEVGDEEVGGKEVGEEEVGETMEEEESEEEGEKGGREGLVLLKTGKRQRGEITQTTYIQTL